MASPATPVVLAALVLAIAVSGRWPSLGLGLVVVVPLLQLASVLPRLESTAWPIYGGILIVIYLAALHGRAVARWTALGLGLPLAAAIAYLLVVPSASSSGAWREWVAAPDRPSTIVTLLTLGGAVVASHLAAWALGLATRSIRRNRVTEVLLRRSDSAAGRMASELELLEERDRLAMDIHDLLGHSLAVVIAQAEGARLNRRADRAQLDEALGAIADAARSASIDVRSLVEGLRDDGTPGPQPTIADLPALSRSMDAAGLRVAVEHIGQAAPLTPAQELAVYRIVQECLTNALRHGDRSVPTRVTLDWCSDALELTVHSPRRPRSSRETAADAWAEGLGIRGMGDRARLAGGRLAVADVGETTDGFRVTAVIPTTSGADRGALTG